MEGRKEAQSTRARGTCVCIAREPKRLVRDTREKEQQIAVACLRPRQHHIIIICIVAIYCASASKQQQLPRPTSELRCLQTAVVDPAAGECACLSLLSRSPNATSASSCCCTHNLHSSTHHRRPLRSLLTALRVLFASRPRSFDTTHSIAAVNASPLASPVAARNN